MTGARLSRTTRAVEGTEEGAGAGPGPTSVRTGPCSGPRRCRSRTRSRYVLYFTLVSLSPASVGALLPSTSATGEGLVRAPPLPGLKDAMKAVRRDEENTTAESSRSPPSPSTSLLAALLSLWRLPPWFLLLPSAPCLPSSLDPDDGSSLPLASADCAPPSEDDEDDDAAWRGRGAGPRFDGDVGPILGSATARLASPVRPLTVPLTVVTGDATVSEVRMLGRVPAGAGGDFPRSTACLPWSLRDLCR